MLALKRSGNLFRGLGRHEDALRLVEAAEAAVQPPALQRELVAQRGWFAVYSGQVETALEVVAPLLDRGDQRSFAEAALAASVAHTLAGRPITAIGLLDDALEVRVGLGDQVQLASPGMYLVALAMARADAGQLHDAHRTALEGYRHAVTLGDRHGQAWLSVVLSRAELLLGRLADAAQHAREAALVFGELGHPGTRWGFGLLAAAAAQRDDAPTAVTALEDLDAEPATPMAMMDVELDRARAWTLIASGHRSAAVEVLGAAAATARSWGQASVEVAVLHDLARVGDAGAVAPRLRELVPVVEGELMAARAAARRGAARRRCGGAGRRGRCLLGDGGRPVGRRVVDGRRPCTPAGRRAAQGFGIGAAGAGRDGVLPGSCDSGPVGDRCGRAPHPTRSVRSPDSLPGAIPAVRSPTT